MSSAVAQRVAALGEGSAGCFDALAALVTASPSRSAEACRRGAVAHALQLLLVREAAAGADSAAQTAAIQLLATLVEATPLAAVALLGLDRCRGCAASREAALQSALYALCPALEEDDVSEENVALYAPCARAAVVGDACARLLCDPAQGDAGDAAARLAVALLATPRRHPRDIALAALFFTGRLVGRAAHAMRCREVVEADDAAAEASSDVRAAGRAATVVAHALAAVPCRATVAWEDPMRQAKSPSTRARLWPAALLCAWRNELPQAAAFALAACRAPRLASTRCAGWAPEQRSRRATLGIAASAVLVICSPLLGRDMSYSIAGGTTVEAAAVVLAERPGAFAGMVAGVHALCLLRGHVMAPLSPLLAGRSAAAAGPYTEVPPRQLLVSLVMHELMRSAVQWRGGGAVFPLKPAALKALRLFSAEERGAGLSHAVLTAALVPYDDADTTYDREPDEPVDPEPQRLVGFTKRSPLLVRPQHPATFQFETLLDWTTTDAVMAALADALPQPQLARLAAPSCGPHEYAALVARAFLTEAPDVHESADNQAASSGFALRGLLQMLGRALVAGGAASDFRVMSWMFTSPGDAAAAAGAFPGSEAPPSRSARWAAQRFADRRIVARDVLTIVRRRLERLAWVRAAESGTLPDVSTLGVADVRGAARPPNNTPHGVSLLAQRAREARQRIDRRATAANRDARDCLRAAAAWAALRAAQGRDVDGCGDEAAPLAAWQHAAYVPREGQERRDALPYDTGYFSPAAVAARVAKAKQPRVLRRRSPPQPPPPPPQAPLGVPVQVALLVVDARFTAQAALLAVSPLLDDMLRVHFDNAAPDTPMRIKLSADVSPDAAADVFALILACLDAAAEAAAVDTAEATEAARKQSRYDPESGPDPIVLPRAALPLASRDDELRPVAPRLGPRISNPQLLLPAWSAARHLQLEAVTDALADPLVQWLSSQEQVSENLAWHQAQAAVMAAPLDDELGHAVARAAVRFAARKLHASGPQGKDAEDRSFLRLWLIGYAAWPLLPEDAMRKLCPDRHCDALRRWVTALGRALHAETALLLPAEARFGRAIGLARRAAQRLHTLEDVAAR